MADFTVSTAGGERGGADCIVGTVDKVVLNLAVGTVR